MTGTTVRVYGMEDTPAEWPSGKKKHYFIWKGMRNDEWSRICWKQDSPVTWTMGKGCGSCYKDRECSSDSK